MPRSTDTPRAQPPRLPRRRRSFAALDDVEVRELSRHVLGDRADDAVVTRPTQGVNNRSYVVETRDGDRIVVKIRPRSAGSVRNSPQWPLYTQRLFGTTSNGAISTIGAVSTVIRRHGGIAVPQVLLAEEARSEDELSFYIAEFLPGDQFGWDTPFPARATQQLGTHLGRLHAATRGEGFGIYSNRAEFAIETWWPRFAHAYTTLLDELARAAPNIRRVYGSLAAALEHALSTGPPQATALISVDQAPTHYLGSPSGSVSGLIDVEGQLWAPPEYELTVAEMWVTQSMRFRTAYIEHAAWPETYMETRAAYVAFTWMEWIYCLHTLLHDSGRAVTLERRLAALFGG